MEEVQEKLLEEYEDFETELEVQSILEKVKGELTLEDQTFREFAERLKELEPEKVEAQRRRAEQAQWYHQRCYPQHTCDWFVEGLDYCCSYWRYQFKRPDTPPPAPLPSPDVVRKRIAPPQSPVQGPRKRCRAQTDRQPSERPKEPGGRKLTGATGRIDPSSPRRPKESCAPAEPPSSTTKAMMTNGQPSQ